MPINKASATVILATGHFASKPNKEPMLSIKSENARSPPETPINAVTKNAPIIDLAWVFKKGINPANSRIMKNTIANVHIKIINV